MPNEPKTPSPMFSAAAFLLGLALAAGASYCMENSEHHQKPCPKKYPATLEAICKQ